MSQKNRGGEEAGSLEGQKKHQGLEESWVSSESWIQRALRRKGQAESNKHRTRKKNVKKKSIDKKRKTSIFGERMQAENCRGELKRRKGKDFWRSIGRTANQVKKKPWHGGKGREGGKSRGPRGTFPQGEKTIFRGVDRSFGGKGKKRDGDRAPEEHPMGNWGK